MIIPNQKNISKIALKFSLFVTAFFFIFVISAGQAAASLGVSVTPSRFSLKAKPGETLKETLTISNPNSFAIKGSTELQDFKVIEGNDIQWIPNDVENPYRMTDWISISKSSAELEPGEQMDITFEIKIPENAAVGGHYAALFLKAAGGEEGKGSVGAVPRVGSLILLDVLGAVKKTGELLSFAVPFYVSHGPVEFKTSFMNTGTTHYQTQADITVRNFFWKSAEISSKSEYAYPGVKRDLVTTWDKKLPLGVYNVQAKVKDGEGNVFEQSRVFIGFPYQYSLIILAIGFLFGGFIWFKKRFSFNLTKIKQKPEKK